MTGDYRTEFPDFGTIDVEIPADFSDVSWRNENCPCFQSEAAQAFLWIDYGDPALREHDGTRRFTLTVAEDGQHPAGAREPLCATDDWSVMLQAVDARRAEMTVRPAV